MWRFSLGCLVLTLSSAAMANECPALLQGELQQLRSKNTVNLCERYAGKPLVVVNTASHCGYTGQFAGLEQLYQTYKDQGVEVLGVPSNDFRQEADNSIETASVCYGNYGVTFTMTEPQVVTGQSAIPLFQGLNSQSKAPDWNFNKYVVDRQGIVVARFRSNVEPDDPKLAAAIQQAIDSTPLEP